MRTPLQQQIYDEQMDYLNSRADAEYDDYCDQAREWQREDELENEMESEEAAEE